MTGRVVAAALVGALLGLLYPSMLGLSGIPQFTRILWVLEFGGVFALLVVFVEQYRALRSKALRRRE